MSRLPTWARLSVRQRITTAVAVLTAASLTVVGLVVFILEAQRIDRAIDAAIIQEIREFRALASSGLDPDTREPLASPDRLLTLFLERSYNEPHEILWGFPTEGRPSYTGDTNRDLERSAEFAALIEQHRAEGGLYTITVEGRQYRVGVQGVGDESPDAAFVVTHDISASRAELRGLLTTHAIVSIIVLLIVSSLASILAGRLLRPVRVLSDTAQRISDGDLSRRIDVSGNDDLTDLQETFNAMLDRLEQAFATQRQLLDDAGHELRTPLTVLRGHLDVLDVNDPEDVAATRELLVDESDRMSRLVEDLLMLAKARRPDFVQPTLTDLSQLLGDVRAKAQALGDRTWKLDAAPDLEVELDGQRMTQALLQLIDNAVKHTGPGDVIGVGAARVDRYLTFWVRDSGPGVSPEDREAIFERFHRGLDVDDGGFGLGLSIVQAIAHAHGGTVSVDDGTTGATFRIKIPLVRAALAQETSP